MSLQKLSGTIENLKCKRLQANFVFVASSKSVMGVTALAAGLAGLSGQAIALAQNADSLEEEANYLEFDLGGQPVKGWVWHNLCLCNVTWIGVAVTVGIEVLLYSCRISWKAGVKKASIARTKATTPLATNLMR